MTDNNTPLPLSWIISEVSEPVLLTNDEDYPVLSIQYNASNRNYGVKVFEKDCQTVSSVPLIGFSDSRSSSAGFIDINVNITLNQIDIEASNIWETSSEGGSFSFCLSTYLISGADKIVTRENRIFEVAITNIINFSIGGVNTYIPNPTVDQDFNITYAGEVKAYECDPVTMDQLTNPPSHGPYDTLNICVKEISNDDLVIGSFFSLTVKQVGGFLSLDKILNGEVQPEYEDLVLSKCVNGICLVSVQLLSEFFVNDEVKEIQVLGSVRVESKNLRDSLPADNKAGEEVQGPFSMFVELDKPSCGDRGNILTSLLGGLRLP